MNEGPQCYESWKAVFGTYIRQGTRNEQELASICLGLLEACPDDPRVIHFMNELTLRYLSRAS